MNMIKIKVNPVFRSLIPPLTDDEFVQLETNCLNDGIRDPLCVWQDILIDGHNRYEISEKHGLDFEIREYDFDNENEVKLWMIDNQKGRRNLSDYVKYELMQVKAEILKEKGREKYENTVGRPNKSLSIIDSDLLEKPKHNTQKEIATELNWSVGKTAMADVVNKRATPETKKKLRRNEVSINQVYQGFKKQDKQEKLAAKKIEYTEQLKKEVKITPIVAHSDYLDYLPTIADNSIDLLLTDPPYATDIDDIESFAAEWLPLALSKVKETGRAYICTGAYPREVQAYLSVLLNQTRFIVDVPLIWTYRNTLGVTPKMKYNLNYQIAWHLYGYDAPPLDTSITNEMFSVQDINAPDGRQGNRFHTWQKPDELGERLIRHSTKKGDKVLDCFCCTGTFLLMAAKLERQAQGCDVDENNLLIAQKRGCDVQF